jgi:hypothetical protein
MRTRVAEDKDPDETWETYWERKHDERHADTGGIECPCLWNVLHNREA